MQVLTRANEKYKGDALLQKVYTVDFLSKKKKRNQGQVPQYYVENDHEAIIPPSLFEAVQEQMVARRQGNERLSSVSIFSGRLKCGDCGSWYGPKVWHSTDKYRRVIWQCNHKFDGQKKCSTPHLDEEAIKELFVKAANILYTEKDEIIGGLSAALETVPCVGIKKFFARLDRQEGISVGFKERLWLNLVDHVTVFGRGDVRFTFKDGTEIEVS